MFYFLYTAISELQHISENDSSDVTCVYVTEFYVAAQKSSISLWQNKSIKLYFILTQILSTL